MYAYLRSDENRRSHTLLSRKSEQRDADRANCGYDKPPPIAYPQGWATCHIQSGLCDNLSLSRYFYKGRRANYVDDIIENYEEFIWRRV